MNNESAARSRWTEERVGGKMISLRAPTGREWLWQTPRRPFRQPHYGARFEDWDISGFDECFPGIAEGPYPTHPWQGTTIPDHGELWTTSWEAIVGEDTAAACPVLYGISRGRNLLQSPPERRLLTVGLVGCIYPQYPRKTALSPSKR